MKTFIPKVRNVFIVLSSRSMPYASRCIRTLLDNCLENVKLTLITDDPEDKTEIEKQVKLICKGREKQWTVYSKIELDDLAKEKFGAYQGYLKFRDGHPCWRKITDPLILADKDEELIILDPDLYFPNKFTFEPTLMSGVQLMYQGPNCLLPPEAVEQTFSLCGTLVDHVDIGIAQLRSGSVDMQWLDWLVSSMESEKYTNYMHIEAIVWSAIAQKIGGGYFNAKAWRCWQRGQVKRVLIALGVKGHQLIRLEPLSKIKCIHVSGPSKWWVDEAESKGTLKEQGHKYDQPTGIVGYIELTKQKFQRMQKMKDTFRKLGYYKLTKSG